MPHNRFSGILKQNQKAEEIQEDPIRNSRTTEMRAEWAESGFIEEVSHVEQSRRFKKLSKPDYNFRKSLKIQEKKKKIFGHP